MVTTHIENMSHFFSLTQKLYKVLIECLSKSYQPLQFNLFNYATLSLLSEAHIKSNCKNWEVTEMECLFINAILSYQHEFPDCIWCCVLPQRGLFLMVEMIYMIEVDREWCISILEHTDFKIAFQSQFSYSIHSLSM